MGDQNRLQQGVKICRHATLYQNAVDILHVWLIAGIEILVDRHQWESRCGNHTTSLPLAYSYTFLRNALSNPTGPPAHPQDASRDGDGLADPAKRRLSAGITNKFSRVEVNSPPRITTAIG